MTEIHIELKTSGRTGSVIYKHRENRVDIYFEISGVPEYDFILAPLDLREWSAPKGVTIPIETQIEILHKLRQWFVAQSIKTDIAIPIHLETEVGACLRQGCGNHRLTGLAFCGKHYDENLLRN